MATQVQRRRGTTAQHAAFSGQLAELTVDTDKMTVVVQDGSTLGGHPLAKEADLTAHITDTTDAHDASAISIADAGGNFTATDVEGALQELSGSTLTHFEEVRNNTAPNDTVPVHAFQPVATELDVDVAFVPKRYGAITASISDGTAVGGNKRGAQSIDLQLARSAATQVASGNDSVLIGGYENTVSGPRSVVLGGGGVNTNSGWDSLIIGGDSNTNTAGYLGTIIGSTNTTLEGGYSYAIGTTFGTLSGFYGGSLGGYEPVDRGLTYKLVFGGRKFSTTEANQYGIQMLTTKTTDATGKALLAGNFNGVSVPGNSNQPILPDNSTFAIKATVVAREPATGDSKVWEIAGVIKRGSGVATTALIGTPTSTVLAADTGAATWTAVLTAEATTYGAARITVTGEAAHTIYWTCKFDTVEIG